MIVDTVPVPEKMQAGDEIEAGLGIGRGIVVATVIVGGTGVEMLAAEEGGIAA